MAVAFSICHTHCGYGRKPNTTHLVQKNHKHQYKDLCFFHSTSLLKFHITVVYFTQKISKIAVTSNLIDEVFWMTTDELMLCRLELTYVSSNILCFGNNCVSPRLVNTSICESSTFKPNEVYREKKIKRRQIHCSMSKL